MVNFLQIYVQILKFLLYQTSITTNEGAEERQERKSRLKRHAFQKHL
jgi:hypothetical protein